MADEAQTAADQRGGKGFFKELSGSAAKRLLEPVAATAATAGTAYLMRKTTHIWNDSVLPKVREKGGGKAYLKDALEQAASKLPGGRGSGFLHGLAKHLEDKSSVSKTAARTSEQLSRTDSGGAQDAATDPEREQQRQQRQRRREQRQRELEKTRST